VITYICIQLVVRNSWQYCSYNSSYCISCCAIRVSVCLSVCVL